MSAAVVLGISGAALVAAKSSEFRRVGFACWVVGNFIWILEGAFTENIYMLIMFGFYWITAIYGFFNTGKEWKNTQIRGYIIKDSSKVYTFKKNS
ncbi:hypothetical protein J2128_002475 [Methanomicrobium sp. W14]|nr:hypothetical protein [Methanomicrobium sp. W14]